jgi:protein EFR3
MRLARDWRTWKACADAVHRNVQVTLQILAALIEKSPKDLPLIAPCVLRVLDLILESDDITMVESSIPTFDTFCEHHDAATLFADQEYVKQYESVIRRYASLASTRHALAKATASKPVAMRWRNAGLEAIKSVATSDALSSVTGRQFHVIVPMILENLWTDNDDFLETLVRRVDLEEKVDSERLIRRRTSISTVRTADTAGDTNPIALSGNAQDVDKLAEEDIGVLAMQCLKQIFVVPSRPQLLSATQALLAFIEERVAQGEQIVTTDPKTGRDGGWAIMMYELIARWGSVQDRYIILVTTMETLVRTPVTEESLALHIDLTAMIGSLLRSDVNLIGLSVMDVLLQLIQHMKRLLQLPGLPAATDELEDERSPSAIEHMELSRVQMKNLLGRIQQCIGDLATHVYYADQISDMIAAILLRLNPGRASSASSSPRGEQDDGAGTNGGTAMVDFADSQQTQVDAYFSFNLAKVAALKAIKAILLVANPSTKMAGTMSLSRNRVPIQVWDGTHWLLRDADGQVRKAFADAFLTWIDRETTRMDQRAKDDMPNNKSSAKMQRELTTATLARRAASSASNRERSSKSRSKFLQYLHLAVYDNALQYMDFETDFLLLHVILAKTVERLGVNAARYGLPMIFRLQEDIPEVELPIQKVRIGSLVHGYFWILTEKFDFEDSLVGRAITNEIMRRRSKHFWIEGITFPPPPVELVGTPGMARPQPKMPLREIESESLLPFDDRLALIDCITVGYQETSISPPISPAASPGRTFAHPVMGQTSSGVSAPQVKPDLELPTVYREQMLLDWTREQALLALQSGSKSESLNGSKAGTSATNRNRLGLNGNGVNGQVAPGPSSPSPYGSQQNLRPGSSHAAPGGGLAPLTKLRKTSVRSGVSPSPSASSRGFVASVDQLKMVLSGQLPGPTGGLLPGTRRDSDSVDSMVSYEYSPSELSFQGVQPEPTQPPPPPPQQSTAAAGAPLQRTASKGKSSGAGGPLSSNPPHESTPVLEEKEEDRATPADSGAVPPVPPLPSLTALSSKSGEINIESHDHAAMPTGRKLGSRGGDRNISSRSGERKLQSRTGERNISSRAGESMRLMVSPSGTESTGTAAMDLQDLLRGIDSRAQEASLGNITRPPY